MFKRKESSSVEERNVRLTHYLKFTQDDLVMNRQGKLSQSQYHEFEGLIKHTSPFILLMAPLILVVAGGFILFQMNQSGFFETADSETVLIVGLGLGGSLGLYAIFMLYAMYRAWKMRDMTPDQYEIMTLSGKVRNIDMQSNIPILKIGKHRVFSYDGGAENAFIKGETYTAYCIKAGGNMKYLLTAEAE